MHSYLESFNLRDDPFRLTPDPSYYYPSQEHVTALLSLEYCMIHKEGFCLLTGEPGTGKTTVLKIFMNIWQERAEIALIMTPRLSPEEFLQAVLDDLNVPLLKPGKNEMIKAFRDFLIGHSLEGRGVAIIVDEAQNLPDDTLEELRLLSNLETDREKLLQIILIGQPELLRKLKEKGLKQLDQRIAFRTALNPLSLLNTGEYLLTRLIKAGNSNPIFTERAIAMIHDFSGGIPRVINILATKAMMVAYMNNSPTVEETHVRLGTAGMDMARGEKGEVGKRGQRTASRWRAAFLMVLLVLAMLALVAGIGEEPANYGVHSELRNYILFNAEAASTGPQQSFYAESLFPEKPEFPGKP